MRLNSIRLFFVSTVSATILAAPAFAFDGQDLLNKINAVYKPQGMEFIAKKVIVDGDEVTMTEAGLILNSNEATAITLGDILLEGVTPKDGGYHIDTITFEDVDFTEGENRFVASDISMENIHVPAYASATSLDGMIFYERATASDLEFYTGESRTLSIDNVFGAMTRDDATDKVSGRLEINEFSIDATDIEEQSTSETLEKLQMELINGSFSAGGTWNTKIGDLDIDELKLSLDNIGTLSASFGVSGYTMELVEGLQNVAKEQASNSIDEDDMAMASMSLLGLSEKLGIKTLLIKFEDASITDRLIDYMAAEQGVSSTEFKTMLKAIVPMYVSELGAPALQQAIVKSVNIYLDNPQTISISAKPKSPVLVPEIFGTAMGNPAALPEVLGLDVHAND